MKTLRFFLMTVVVGAVTVGAQSNGQLNFVFNVITSHHLAMYDTLNFVSTGFKSGQDIGSDTMSTELSRIEPLHVLHKKKDRCFNSAIHCTGVIGPC